MESSGTRPVVVVVDDDEEFLFAARAWLSDSNISMVGLGSPEEAVRYFRQGNDAVAMVIDGVSHEDPASCSIAVHEIRKMRPSPCLYIFCGTTYHHIRALMMSAGCDEVTVKRNGLGMTAPKALALEAAVLAVRATH